jgi:hypothetical protein
MSYISQLLSQTPDEWHGATLLSFTGEAPEEYFAFLDANPEVAALHEQAFSEYMGAFEEVVARAASAEEKRQQRIVKRVTADLVAGFQSYARLSRFQRWRCRRKIIKGIENDAKAKARREVGDFLALVKNALVQKKQAT